ncbi:hypothetical protein N7450_007657 [Penicillium hetheringtonii]|uniref:Uncharacterized protein n=1 Tax=Penicillium hetheringtonii TaxID=911720 RepID=A0AAD6DI01_9EURO|nr:hypothetical protein N7450_007657 [Penicillium hetheringtonii]
MDPGEGSGISQQRGTARPRNDSPIPGQTQAKRYKSSTEKSPERVRIRDDVEFARDDWDGRIKRCEERIKDGYLKEIFEKKLERLKKARDTQSAVMKQFFGKSWEVIQRMANLQKIADHLKKIKDPYQELVNVEAILAAYKAGKLEWNDHATYWCQGKMIAGPSPFSFEDFGKLKTDENRGNGGFWVEGIYPLTLTENVCKYISPPSATDTDVHINIVLRLDGGVGQFDLNGNAYPEVELDFQEDTGAQMMFIYNDDMINLMAGDIKI